MLYFVLLGVCFVYLDETHGFKHCHGLLNFAVTRQVRMEGSLQKQQQQAGSPVSKDEES
jgi:hypothetical protein